MAAAIRGTWNSDYNDKKNDWKIVAEMMAAHEFPFEKLITETYSLSEYEKAFAYLTDKTKSKTKTYVCYGGIERIYYE